MKKMSNKKGFTLMEMLIVVAIIAILVAIAIPTFSSSLKKANIAADKANIRAWYAETVIDLMLDDTATAPTAYNGVALKAGTATVSTTSGNGFSITYTAGSETFTLTMDDYVVE